MISSRCQAQHFDRVIVGGFPPLSNGHLWVCWRARWHQRCTRQVTPSAWIAANGACYEKDPSDGLLSGWRRSRRRFLGQDGNQCGSISSAKFGYWTAIAPSNGTVDVSYRDSSPKVDVRRLRTVRVWSHDSASTRAAAIRSLMLLYQWQVNFLCRSCLVTGSNSSRPSKKTFKIWNNPSAQICFLAGFHILQLPQEKILRI